MTDNFFLQNYENDDVVSFNSRIFKVGNIVQVIKSAFGHPLETALNQQLKSQNVEIQTEFYALEVENGRNKKWFGEGIDCEILKIGAKGWQKGKLRIRVTVEFCPDEPEIPETPVSNSPEINKSESPLDDIRQMMNQDS